MSDTDNQRDGIPSTPTHLSSRSLSKAPRRLVVCEAPEHEACAKADLLDAATASAAIILLDASAGEDTYARRCAHTIAIFRVPRVLLAIDKMDRVGFSASRFDAVAAEFLERTARFGLRDVHPIPISALLGDNLTTASDRMPWYLGPTVAEWLQSIDLSGTQLAAQSLRLPVQRLRRSPSGRVILLGMIVGGVVHADARVVVQTAGRTASVARIFSNGKQVTKAVTGQLIELELREDIDAACGDLIATADAPAEVARQFEAVLVWLHARPLLAGRRYCFSRFESNLPMQITSLKYKMSADSPERLAARELTLHEIGVVNISVEWPIAFDSFIQNRHTGSFTVVDSATNEIVGAGLIRFALRRAHNIHTQPLAVNKAARARIKGQKPCLLWLTGLPSAGKSTIANIVERDLHALGRHTYLLDGDNVRLGLNSDLGFTAADRVENIRRVGEVAKLMVDAGLMVIAAFISPFRAERQLVRSLFAAGEFIEIFVDAPLEVVEARDPKGLYAKARRGELKNFTGIDSPYETPESPDLRLDTSATSAEAAAERVILMLRERGFI
jgi:bifunctional enzyme CysN/CysC